MKTMIKNLLTLLTAVVLISPALAQTPTTTTAPNPGIRPLQELRDKAKGIREDARSGVKDIRQGALNTIKGLRDSNRDKIEAAREAVRKELGVKREEFRAKIEDTRNALRDRLEKEKEDFKTKIGVIKDERRRQLTERIDSRLKEINARRQDHFGNVLDNLDNIISRISSRRDKALDRGIDVVAVDVAIAEAHKAIDAARAAVVAQAGKTYPFSITDDNALRDNVNAARTALENDLKGIRDILQAAHDAVRKAAVALAQVPRVDDDSDDTPVGTTTTSSTSSTNQ